MKKCINKLLLSVLSISLIVASSCAMHDSNSHEDIALRYINFLNKVSPSSGQDAFPKMASLFSPNCHKVVNGKLSSKNIVELETQLREAQCVYGAWTIEPNQSNCFLFPEDNTYVLQYDVANVPDQKTSIVTKYITFDDNGLITNINEVFNTKTDNAFFADPQEIKPSSQTDSVTLKQAAQRYIEFLQHFGKPGEQETYLEMTELISSSCLKIVNGGIVSRGADCIALFEFGLNDQLRDMKERFGSWTIELDQEGVIANLQKNVCMVRYDLKSSKSQETYTFIAYLRFNKNGKIQEIDELYNKKDS